MSGVGGVGGGGGSGYRSEESQEPSGPSKSFQIQSNWKSQVEHAADLIHPDDPQDAPEAVRMLTQLADDPKTPQPVQTTARRAAEQIEQGYMVSRNPIELTEPYLALCNITQPIGPGPFS